MVLIKENVIQEEMVEMLMSGIIILVLLRDLLVFISWEGEKKGNRS
ncbi:MAG: hypothetical protein GY786_22530 [Proteobacteria bacterium]|nr:hypothetical protein [Pseudomonadota bacterium]